MKQSLLAGLCPNCNAYVMLSPGIKESQVVSCSDCKTPLIAEHITAIKTVLLTKIPEVIPL